MTCIVCGSQEPQQIHECRGLYKERAALFTENEKLRDEIRGCGNHLSYTTDTVEAQLQRKVAQVITERDALLAEQLEWSKQKWTDEKRIKQLEAEREELRKRAVDLEGDLKGVKDLWGKCSLSLQKLESDLRNEMNANIQLHMDKREIINTIRGLSHGVDWNNGTHAKEYRPRLLALLEKYGNEQSQDK